jgi:uncharacterized protein YcfJ
MSLVRSVLIHRTAGKLFSRVGKMILESAEKEFDMIPNLQRTVAVLLVVCTLPAWAGRYDDRYPGSGNQYDYAKVIDAQPVFDIVQVPEERQVCRQQPVHRRVAEYRSPGPAIFGAILGGVIGNQVSRSHGGRHGHRHSTDRAAATFAGAAIGGAIASEIQYSKHPARYYTENIRLCEIQTGWRSEKRIVAWDVRWKYRGQVYHSRMAEPPGDRIRVRVSVDPVYR